MGVAEEILFLYINQLNIIYSFLHDTDVNNEHVGVHAQSDMHANSPRFSGSLMVSLLISRSHKLGTQTHAFGFIKKLERISVSRIKKANIV